MPIELSETDLARLEDLRLKRFRTFFPCLKLATLHINFENELLIICKDADDVQALLMELELLESLSYCVAAASALVVYQSGIEKAVYTNSLQSWVFELESESNIYLDSEDSEMSTAILEKPVEATGSQPSTPQSTQWLPINTVANMISGFTGENQEAVINQILATQPKMQYSNGQFLLPTNLDFAALKNNFGSANGGSTTSTNGAAPTTKKTARSTTAKSTSTRKPASKTTKRPATKRSKPKTEE